MSEKPAKKPKKLNTCPCGLQETCEGPMMEPGGMGRRGIMVIAEAPGREEDAAYAREITLAKEEGRGPLGTQLIGNAGKRLAKELMRYNIDLYEDCWLTNSCACRPPKNRTPTSNEISACRPRVLKAIEELKPRFILVLGAVGLESLLAHRWYDGEGGLGGIGRWRGWQAPDQDLGAWVCPTFHPSYVLRCESGNDPQVPLYFSLDIERFAELVDHPKPWPEPPQEEQVKILTERRAARLLTDLLEGSGAVTIDYETTGLKPNAPGHQIVCVGIGWGDDNAAAFQMTPRLEPILADFLASKAKKIAQNLQFEERWSRVCLGTSVNGWCWDTMLAAHCLDNRGHISGLKFQSYVQLGITDYSSEISPYLKASSSLGMNRVLEAPREKLLRYCGMDALCTARIADIQSRRFEAGDAPWDGIQLLLEGAMILADDEENGVVVDRAYIRQQKTHFKKRIAAVLRRIEQSPEGQAWLEKYGDKLKFSSTQQLAWVLFDYMKLPIGKTTPGGKPSVDVEVLQELENKAPLVADVLEMRKLEKISGTYLTGWEREIGPDGIMRPFYHLAAARTFRSCVAKGTKILVCKNFEDCPNGIPIEEVKIGDPIYCFDNDLNPAIRKVVWAGKTGHREVVRVHWQSLGGHGSGYLDVTPEHLIRLIDGSYEEAQKLDPKFYDYRKDGESKHLPKVRVLSCCRVDDTLRFTGHLKYGNSVLEHRMVFEHFNRKWGNQFGEFKPGNHVITKVEWIKEKVDVYDIEVEDFHNFFANEICVHNSSSSPNLQNVPIRDKIAQRACRRAVYPRAGHRLVEVDYSGIEVRVSACVHKDPQMIKYITDKTTDMHRDMAMECYKLELDEVSKAARQGAKNQFVFPEFYGSYWKNTGPGLWKWAQDCETAQGVSLIKHLKKHGLGTELRFMKHIRKVEDRFWNERFRVYNQWKEKFWKRYLRNGYFETLTGFRCQGPMRKNEVVNYPIQGPAFHCLLKAKALTKQWIAEQRLEQDVLPCGQVHDSGMFSTAPDVFEHFAVNVHRIWCEELRKAWDWIIVPLEIEIDATPVDGNWFRKEEYKIEVH